MGEFTTGHIRPIPTTAAYRLALAVVVPFMICLPLAYVGLVVGACSAVYWHATRNVHLLEIGGIIIPLIIYVAPVVGGAVLVLFLVKPLVMSTRPVKIRVTLDEPQEARFVTLVSELASAVGAPAPRRIDLTAEVNASASLRSGFLSVFSRDLVLTIGLPLVYGLDARGLAAVVAHELGHFAQSTFFRSEWCTYGMPFPISLMPVSRACSAERLEAVRRAVVASEDDVRSNGRAYEDADRRLTLAFVAQCLTRAGARFDPDDLEIDAQAIGDIDACVGALEASLGQTRQTLVTLAAPQLERLALILASERAPREMAEFVDALVALERLRPAIDRLHNLRVAVLALSEHSDDYQNAETFHRVQLETSEQGVAILGELRKQLADVENPCSYAPHRETLDVHVVEHVPVGRDRMPTIDAPVHFGLAVDSWLALYRRFIGLLAACAEDGERALGLEPLPLRESVTSTDDPGDTSP